MCRHLAWLGEPRTLTALVLDPPFGLLRQSYAPRRQARGLVNADGWGVGFFPAGRDVPVRWRSARPLWGDASFASVAPVLSTRCLLAAVRSATLGMPIEETAVAPFGSGPWLLSHNGRVDRAVLKPESLPESVCDSAVLAAEIFDLGPERAGQSVREIAARDPRAILNLLLTDGTVIVGTTWGDTLCYRVLADGVMVASEAADDEPGWIEVPDRSLLLARPGEVAVSRLEVP